MLEKVTQKWQYHHVYQHGRKQWNHRFVLYICKNGRKHSRLGLTVSKKVGKSVQRNRVKRLIREVFRLNQHRIADGYDIVVVARRAATELKYQQAEGALLYLLRRMRTLKNDRH